MRAPAGGENMSIMQMYAKYLNMAKTSTGKGRRQYDDGLDDMFTESLDDGKVSDSVWRETLRKEFRHDLRAHGVEPRASPRTLNQFVAGLDASRWRAAANDPEAADAMRALRERVRMLERGAAAPSAMAYRSMNQHGPPPQKHQTSASNMLVSPRAHPRAQPAPLPRTVDVRQLTGMWCLDFELSSRYAEMEPRSAARWSLGWTLLFARQDGDVRLERVAPVRHARRIGPPCACVAGTSSSTSISTTRAKPPHEVRHSRHATRHVDHTARRRRDGCRITCPRWRGRRGRGGARCPRPLRSLTSPPRLRRLRSCNNMRNEEVTLLR